MQAVGISTQINTTVTRHNAHQLPEMVELAKRLKVDAFHLFLLVPVGCGLTIAEDQSVSAEDAERILNWYYDRSLQRHGTQSHLRAAVLPHCPSTPR